MLKDLYPWLLMLIASLLWYPGLRITFGYLLSPALNNGTILGWGIDNLIGMMIPAMMGLTLGPEHYAVTSWVHSRFVTGADRAAGPAS